MPATEPRDYHWVLTTSRNTGHGLVQRTDNGTITWEPDETRCDLYNGIIRHLATALGTEPECLMVMFFALEPNHP